MLMAFATSALWISCLASRAGEAQTNSFLDSTSWSIEGNFTRGWHEATAGVGVMLSPGYFSAKDRPTVNYFSGFGQVGYMLNDTRGETFLRGNFELAPELFGSAIWEATGDYILGSTLWVRYNFVPRGSRFSPYVQLGAGVTATDIDHRYDGQDFNFNLGVAGGVRYFISSRISLNFEYRYQHISNADTANRNIGINATGPVFGLSWFF